MPTYTKEKDCVEAAKNEYFTTRIPQLIFKKKRQYVYVAGKLMQDSKETFTNPFGQIMHYSEVSDIRKQYQSNGYELRGWVDDNGSFKFN